MHALVRRKEQADSRDCESGDVEDVWGELSSAGWVEGGYAGGGVGAFEEGG